jgi:hypothetical protein
MSVLLWLCGAKGVVVLDELAVWLGLVIVSGCVVVIGL